MQINISTRHGHLSAETQDKLTAKLTKLSRFHDRLTSVNATVDLEHPESPQIEVRVSVEHAEDFVATDHSSSLIGSLDAVAHKLEQQLRKHKEKITDRRHSGTKDQRDVDGQKEEEEEEEGQINTG